MRQAPLHETSAPAGSSPRKRLGQVAWIVGLAIAGACAYSIRVTEAPGHPMPSKQPAEDQVVARVGETAITETEFRAAWQKKQSPGEADSSNRATALLEELVRRELLFAEATRTKFTEREDVRTGWKAFVVSRFREELESRIASSAKIDDAAIAAYFQENAARFAAPERRRLAMIHIGRPPAAASERQTEMEQVIARVRDHAVSQSATTPDFGDLAALHSAHTASRRRGGDVGWLSRAQAYRVWPAPVVEAAFSLSAPGEISPIVPTEEGWFLVKWVEREQGRLPSLDSVRERIRRELARARETEAETALFDELRSRHPVQINAERLSSSALALDLAGTERAAAPRPPLILAP